MSQSVTCYLIAVAGVFRQEQRVQLPSNINNMPVVQSLEERLQWSKRMNKGQVF